MTNDTDENEAEIDLAAWVDGIRRSIVKAERSMVEKAQSSGEAPEVLFTVAEVRFDVEVKAERKTKGNAQLGPSWLEFKVLTGTLEHERSKARTQKLSIVLRPLGDGGVVLGEGEGELVFKPPTHDNPSAHDDPALAKIQRKNRAATKKALKTLRG